MALNPPIYPPPPLPQLPPPWPYTSQHRRIGCKACTAGSLSIENQQKEVHFGHHSSTVQAMLDHAVLQVRHDFDEPDFAMIDTLFSLAEAHLFMQLVELQDREPHLLPAGKTRPDLYRYATI